MSIKRPAVALSGVFVMSMFGFSTLAAPSYAATSTVQHIDVRRNAYLVSAPHLHAQRDTLEAAGQELTVLPGSTSYWWHVRDGSGRVGYMTTNTYWTSTVNTQTGAAATSGSAASSGSAATSVGGTSPASGASTTPTTVAGQTTTFALPPGVSYSAAVHPLAAPTASYAQKLHAVLTIADSKLGTPYRWGHNEDRGQYGFDCSNFTDYVYHHALGYVMSGASQVQYHSVGWVVPISQMRPGDLVIFDHGGHVGIYAGNGQMVQEGGGLGKAGYLPLHPGSYWYSHITTVKRMF